MAVHGHIVGPDAVLIADLETRIYIAPDSRTSYSAGPDKQNLWGSFGNKEECVYQRIWAARSTGVATVETMDLKFSPCFKAANSTATVNLSGMPDSTVTIQPPTSTFKFGQ